MTFAAMVPGLVVSPFAGVLLDRVGPTIAVLVDMIASAAFVASISIAGWAGWTNLPVLSILVVLFFPYRASGCGRHKDPSAAIGSSQGPRPRQWIGYSHLCAGRRRRPRAGGCHRRLAWPRTRPSLDRGGFCRSGHLFDASPAFTRIFDRRTHLFCGKRSKAFRSWRGSRRSAASPFPTPSTNLLGEPFTWSFQCLWPATTPGP